MQKCSFSLQKNAKIKNYCKNAVIFGHFYFFSNLLTKILHYRRNFTVLVKTAQKKMHFCRNLRLLALEFQTNKGAA